MSAIDSYREHIFFEIRPSDGYVVTTIIFSNFAGPFETSDFTSEPSFIELHFFGGNLPPARAIHWNFFPPIGTMATGLSVTLNKTNLGEISEGRLVADSMKKKFEDRWEIPLPYVNNSETTETITYTYLLNECPIFQELKDLFFELKPPSGFGDVVTPDFFGDYGAIGFLLNPEGHPNTWNIKVTSVFNHQFSPDLLQEHSISVKELTGHTGIIESSPDASASHLRIFVFHDPSEYTITSCVTTPPRISPRSRTINDIPVLEFHQNLRGSQASDIALRFRIEPSSPP